MEGDSFRSEIEDALSRGYGPRIARFALACIGGAVLRSAPFCAENYETFMTLQTARTKTTRLRYPQFSGAPIGLGLLIAKRPGSNNSRASFTTWRDAPSQTRIRK
jgi:hypothetical protein